MSSASVLAMVLSSVEYFQGDELNGEVNSPGVPSSMCALRLRATKASLVVLSTSLQLSTRLIFSTSTVMQVESFVDEHAISKEPPAATIVGVEVAALELVTPDVSVVLEQAAAVNARRMLAVSAYAFSLFLLREGQCHP